MRRPLRSGIARDHRAGMAARKRALSAAVGAPVPPRALTMLSSIGLTNPEARTISCPIMIRRECPLGPGGVDRGPIRSGLPVRGERRSGH